MLSKNKFRTLLPVLGLVGTVLILGGGVLVYRDRTLRAASGRAGSGELNGLRLSEAIEVVPVVYADSADTGDARAAVVFRSRAARDRLRKTLQNDLGKDLRAGGVRFARATPTEPADGWYEAMEAEKRAGNLSVSTDFLSVRGAVIAHVRLQVATAAGGVVWSDEAYYRFDRPTEAEIESRLTGAVRESLQSFVWKYRNENRLPYLPSLPPGDLRPLSPLSSSSRDSPTEPRRLAE